MRPPRASKPIVIVVAVLSVALLQGIVWQYIRSGLVSGHVGYDATDAFAFALMLDGLLLWVVYAGYKRFYNVPLKPSDFWGGTLLILFAGFMGDGVLRVFAQAQNKARPATCISNLKQISLGVLQYRVDWDEEMPPSSHWAMGSSTYIKQAENAPLWHCTDATSPYSYASNHALSGLSTSDLENQPEVIMLFESDATIWNAAGGKESLPKPGRHNGGGMFAFFDGHATHLQDTNAIDSRFNYWQPVKTTKSPPKPQARR